MYFSDKLDLLLAKTEISNIKLANATNINPSTISRFRTGARVPKLNGTTFQDLATGIVKLISNDDLYILRDTCNIAITIKEEIPLQITKWLLDSEDIISNKNEINRKYLSIERKEKLDSFSNKFNELMKIVNISNIQLSKAIDTDPSLISRVRSGDRIPKSNSQIVELIASYFSKRNYTLTQKNSLAHLLSTDLKLIEKMTSNDLYDELMTFFFKEENYFEEKEKVDKFIQRFDMYKIMSNEGEFSLSNIWFNDGIKVESDSYYGTEGIKNSTLRLFKRVLKSKEKHTIYIYMNYTFTWLNEDLVYYQKWIYMLRKMAFEGHKLIIIHDLDRKINAIFNSLQIWFPLYLTGLVDTYFLPKQKGVDYVSNFLVADNIASIIPLHINNTQECSEYIYSESRRRNSFMVNQIRKLVEISSPLMQTTYHQVANQYSENLKKIDGIDADVTSIIMSFPIGSIPFDCFERILNRHDLTEEEKNQLRDYHNKRVKQFYHVASLNKVTNYCFLPSIKLLNQTKIKLDLPFGNKEIYYSIEDFSDICKHIIKIKDEYPNYNLIPIGSLDYKNIKIVVKHNVCAYLVKNDPPHITFSFDQVTIIQAFEKYIAEVAKKAARSKGRKTLEAIQKYYEDNFEEK